MNFLRKINFFDDEHAESVIGVSNSLDPRLRASQNCLETHRRAARRPGGVLNQVGAVVGVVKTMI